MYSGVIYGSSFIVHEYYYNNRLEREMCGIAA